MKLNHRPYITLLKVKHILWSFTVGIHWKSAIWGVIMPMQGKTMTEIT